MSYLKNKFLPTDREKARKLRVSVEKFVLMDEVLYKRSFSQPYLRCLTPDESYYVRGTSTKEPMETIQGLNPLSIK